MFRKLCILGAIGLASAPVGFALTKTAPALPNSLKTMIEAPLWPQSIPDPTRQRVLYLERAPVVPLEFLAAPAVGLAGAQVDPKLWAVKRRSINTNPTLLSLQTRQTIPLNVPRHRHVEAHRFSPDGKWLALTLDGDQGVELWIADAATGQARSVKQLFINDSFVQGALIWSADSQTLYAATRPNVKDTLKPADLDGPTIEEAEGVRVPARTYAYLLRTADDQKLFAKVATAQIRSIEAKTLKVADIGPALPLQDFSLAPSGQQMLVESFAAPYSLAVPAGLFAIDVNVLDLKSKRLQKVLHSPVAETVPPEGERIGPRSVRWQLDHPARLLWVEALDEGDPRKKVPHRDRLMSWDLPFAGQSQEVLRTEERLEALEFLPKPDQFTVLDVNHDTNRVHVDFFDAKTNTRRRLLDFDSKDAYKHPGQFVRAPDAQGAERVAMDGDRLFLTGQGRNPKGEQPFLDAMDVTTGTITRLYQSPAEANYVEDFFFMKDRKADVIALLRQSTDSPPNLWLHDFKSGKKEVVTHFTDNVPAMTQAKKQPLVYQRKDGITLSGTLYLPYNYVPGTRLPAIVWAYPEEYRSKDSAGQVRVSDKRYSRPSPIGVEWLVTQGYAVLNNAAMPVIGDKETVNNTFVEQIVDNAAAAIEAMDKLGVVDRQRVAIGGHSYGAFMTANLLAHSKLFCAGVARSGAYNRSLTPFGFQSERRTFWEAKDFYMLVSPFAEADKIKTPLLLIHGKNDNNPGTTPMQSERMFQAVRGVGGTARLVMLPYESHAYRAKENVELTLGESLDWLNRNCGPVQSTAAQ